MSALGDIAAERQRQKDVEGWTDYRDDEYVNCELARAAATYAASAAMNAYPTTASFYNVRLNTVLTALWPWSMTWWKPKSARRDLVRAGALIVAEIERLDRKMNKG